MFGTHFYNERIRRSVAIFGSLFDNIYIIRKSGSEVIGQMKVPLSYGPSRKFLERINEMINGEESERQVAIKLPRMSFEMTNVAYDAARQLPKMNYFTKYPSDKTTADKYYVSVPYIISFQLNVYAKSQDDALQVVEQVLPYFSPQYTISVKPFSGVDISEDIPIILTAVGFSDDYEGAMETRRTIVYTLDFDMKISFYGPKPTSQGVIREVNTNYFSRKSGLKDSDEFLEAIAIRLNPFNTSKDSDFTYTLVRYDDSAQ